MKYFNHIVDDQAIIKPGPNENHTAYCRNAYNSLKDEATAVGEAFARAFAQAAVSITTKGSSTGCGSASAKASAEASATAQVLVDASVQSKLGTTLSKAKAVFDARKNVIVNAYAAAEAEACLYTEGVTNALQTTLSEALAHPVATAMIDLVADIKCDDAVSSSKGSVDTSFETNLNHQSNGFSTTTGNPADVSTNGSGNATAAEECTGKYTVCCENLALTNGVCSCTSTDSCQATLSYHTGKILWLDTAGETNTCYCPYY